MNKLRGTRSTGCKGKAGKEGGSKQGQTGTDEKTKGRSRGGWGWAENGENAGNTGNTGNAGNRRWKQKSQEMYTGNAQYKKDCGIASAVFCLLLPVRQGQPAE